MPSTRLTKTNIDRNLLAAMQIVAAAEGVSTSTLLEKMWLKYVGSNANKT